MTETIEKSKQTGDSMKELNIENAGNYIKEEQSKVL